jgi:hypothetical protein
MPSERLIIENFKGISHLDLEVKPFTVLIGPQSVGKSVVAKLLYFFKTLPLQVFYAAIRNSESSLDSQMLDRFGKLLPPPNRMAGKSAVRYSIGDATFSLSDDGDDNATWKIELPPFLQAEFLRIKAEFSDLAKKEQEAGSFADLPPLRISLQNGFAKNLEKRLGERSSTSVWFIPAGRSFYSQIERDVVSFFESANLDPFLGLYGRFLPHLKESVEFRSANRWKTTKLAGELTESLLSGKYEREGQKDFINVKDGRRLPPALWSSGQQESLPLALHMRRWIEGILQPGERIGLFIEEPEAHLFPASQRIMMELIALAFNSAPRGTNIFITTHSPYVLSTLNVLLKAGQLFQQSPAPANHAAIERIVPELEALAPGTAGAYYMDRSKCRSIMDAETGLIDGRAIDDVSGELAEQFDALNDLK